MDPPGGRPSSPGRVAPQQPPCDRELPRQVFYAPISVFTIYCTNLFAVRYNYGREGGSSMLFRQSPDVIARPEGSKTLVFHQKSGRFCILNSTSFFLWEQCTGEKTCEQLSQLLADQFEIPGELAEPGHLLNLVNQHLAVLHKARLLETVPV